MAKACLVIEAIAEGGDWRRIAASHFPGGSLGNGAAMRVAPIGLLFNHDLDRVMVEARLSALPTHIHPLGIEGAQAGGRGRTRDTPRPARPSGVLP